MHRITLISIFVGLLCQFRCASSDQRAVARVGVPLTVADIRYTDESYRKYVGKRDPKRPWHNGYDILTNRGYSMTPVQAPVVHGLISTSLGAMGLSADTPFILQDFHQAYHLKTVWPYCDSTTKCLVYVQESNPAAPKAPMTLTFPAGVAAVDLYIDAAIDCVQTLRAVVKCKALVQPGAVEVKFKVVSVCASPFVGKYIGFFDESGDSITSLQLTCKSTAPTAIGLVRLGTKQPQSTL